MLQCCLINVLSSCKHNVKNWTHTCLIVGLNDDFNDIAAKTAFCCLSIVINAKGVKFADVNQLVYMRKNIKTIACTLSRKIMFDMEVRGGNTFKARIEK